MKGNSNGFVFKLCEKKKNVVKLYNQKFPEVIPYKRAFMWNSGSNGCSALKMARYLHTHPITILRFLTHKQQMKFDVLKRIVVIRSNLPLIY